jgi:hypothetical protein
MLADVKKLMDKGKHLTPEEDAALAVDTAIVFANINDEYSHASRVIALVPHTVKRIVPGFG